MKKIIIFSLLLCSITYSHASFFTPNKEKLTHINHSIENIKAELTQEQKLRNYYEKKLKQLELAESFTVNQLIITKNKLAQQEKQLILLKQQTDKYQQAIDKQQSRLAEQVRKAYMLPNPPILKLLLEESDTMMITHMRMYYHYLTQNEAEMIRHLRQNIEKLHLYQQQSQHQSLVLQQLQTEQQQEHHKFVRLKNDRQQIVSDLNDRILTKNQKLDQLIENKHRLEQTIWRLQQTNNLKKSNFDTLKGKLSWPVQGHITHQFGDKIYRSELKWSGVVIAASVNQPVRTIADGKVIFADWLPGYGLLLIINHGNGYMSLYGRNHSLYKKVGDLVRQGDTIARVGNSGGYQTPGLYFDIRRNAQPLDPTEWCLKTNS